MLQTSNYSLNKPEQTDVVNIDDINGNMDIIDAEIKKVNDKKVEKESGKGLSSNDYTATEKSKLAGIAEKANNYVHPGTHPASMITGLPTSLPANGGNAATVGGLQPYQLGTIGASGQLHGTDFLMQVKHNIDGDDRFKAQIYRSDGTSVSHQVRVDYATGADTIDGKHASDFIATVTGYASNLDTTYKAGRYYFNDSTAATPCTYGICEVIVGAGGDTYNGSSNWIWQTVYNVDAEHVYTRNRINNSAWSAWVQISGSTTALDTGSNLSGINGTVRVLPIDHAALSEPNWGYPYVCQCTNGPNVGLAGGWWHIQYYRHMNSDGYGAQLAISLNITNTLCIRNSNGGTWNSWRQVTPHYGIYDLTAGVSALPEGEVYYVYE